MFFVHLGPWENSPREVNQVNLSKNESLKADYTLGENKYLHVSLLGGLLVRPKPASSRNPTSHLVLALSKERTKGEVGSLTCSPTEWPFSFLLSNTHYLMKSKLPLLPFSAAIKSREPALFLTSQGFLGTAH